MQPHVVVLGGGVAGMSAAHELVERGFRVSVYEKKSVPGGKARSIPKPGTGRDGRKDLPGEHGFRFFPRFYRHVTDTMKRIPYGTNADGVYGNLVQASRDMLARAGRRPFVFPARFPRDLADLRCILEDLFQSTELGLTHEEMSFFAERVWQLMTSCEQRVEQEYERIGWWEFMQADRFTSPAYRTLLVEGLTHTLVAAKARSASTRSGGVVLTELVFESARPGRSDDNLLNGPTSEVWLQPWYDYLIERGVAYHFDSELTALHCRGGRLSGTTVEQAGKPLEVTGDYYVVAVPVERMAPLLTEELLRADATLAGIRKLAEDVDWMNGIQFFLSHEAPIVNGHVSYIDSPWALTSISDGQFWTGVDLADYGDGTLKGLLSVDISNWDEKGVLFGKTARECTPEEIRAEVWEQIKRSVDVDGEEPLRDEWVIDWFLDTDISRDPKDRTDSEPLLVNKVRTWDLRPDAATGIPNLFLASDYVRTNTNLATMEGANEAARRAVNAIIDASGVSASYCRIWPLYQPLALAPARWYDAWRFARGLPWKSALPWPFQLAHHTSVESNRWAQRLDPLTRPLRDRLGL
jgi:15-cis-phytoene desaturase